MSDYFVVRDQHGQYINKQKEWVDGSEPKTLYRTKHKDEAINMVVELSAKDIYLRAMAFPCELDDKLQPIVEICENPPAKPISEEENSLEESESSSEAESQMENSATNE